MYFTKAREDEINLINAKLLGLLPESEQHHGFDDDGTYFDAELFPINPEYGILVHTTSIA